MVFPLRDVMSAWDGVTQSPRASQTGHVQVAEWDPPRWPHRGQRHTVEWRPDGYRQCGQRQALACWPPDWPQTGQRQELRCLPPIFIRSGGGAGSGMGDAPGRALAERGVDGLIGRRVRAGLVRVVGQDLVHHLHDPAGYFPHFL